MSTWFEPDDEIARRLEQTLRQEADAMSIPEKFDQVVDAAQGARRRRTTGIMASIAAGVTIVALAGGYVASQGGLRGTPGPAGGGPTPAASGTPSASPDATPSASPTPSSTPSTSPTPSQSPSASATPPPNTTPAVPKPTKVTGSQLGFASPTGNLVCTMDVQAGVRCHAMQANWTGKDVPQSKLKGCDPGYGDFGPGQDVILTREGSFGNCVSELSVFEAIATNDGQPNPYGTEYRSWAGKDTKLVEFLPGMKAYVLPYGTTATAGQFSCGMSDMGITCGDANSGAMFHLSRNDLTLR